MENSSKDQPWTTWYSIHQRQWSWKDVNHSRSMSSCVIRTSILLLVAGFFLLKFFLWDTVSQIHSSCSKTLIKVFLAVRHLNCWEISYKLKVWIFSWTLAFSRGQFVLWKLNYIQASWPSWLVIFLIFHFQAQFESSIVKQFLFFFNFPSDYRFNLSVKVKFFTLAAHDRFWCVFGKI